MVRFKRLAIMTAFGTAALGMGMNTLPAEAAQISGITSSQLVVSAEKATATDAEKSDADSKDKNADEISDETASDKKELSGWVYNQAYEGYAYYKDNSPVRGWNTIDGRKYFFDTNGILMEGFQTIGTTLPPSPFADVSRDMMQNASDSNRWKVLLAIFLRRRTA